MSATRYLTTMCGTDGRFVYRVNLDPQVKIKPKYNLLRHAGAMYALAMFIQAQSERSPESAADAMETLQRAARFLRDEAIAPLTNSDDILAVWTRPELSGQTNPTQAKLGGAGLALVALVGLESCSPTSTPVATLRGLARFLVYMQKDDGSFYSKFIPARGGRQEKWVSLYYPGEAALGLLMLHEMDPDPVWLEAARRALAYLARSREGQQDVPADHWALLATAQLPEFGLGQSNSGAERALLDEHARQIVEVILRGQVWESKDARCVGGFTPDGRTTPTATRLEALLAALSFFPKSDDLSLRVRSSIKEGMMFLLRAQIHGGAHEGAVPRAVCRLTQGDPRKMRSFNRRATEIRIDYVQHALCAMLEYDRLMV